MKWNGMGGDADQLHSELQQPGERRHQQQQPPEGRAVEHFVPDAVEVERYHVDELHKVSDE